MVTWIISCILVMPWIVLPLANLTEQFRAPKALFFDIMCMGIIVFGLARGLKFQYRNKYLAFLSAWIFFGFVFNWYIPTLISPVGQIAFNVWTIEPSLHFVLALFATWIVISHLHKEDYVRIANTLCISATIVAVVGLLQYIGLNPFKNFLHYTHDMHISAFLDNPMLVGHYLCLTVPLFLYFNKWKHYAGLALVLLCIFLTNSDLAMGAAIAGIIIFFFFTSKYKRLFLIGLLLLTLGAYLYFQHHDLNLYKRFSVRLEIWPQAIPFFKENPLFGQGLGRWKTLGISYKSVWWMEAHNDWFERTIELGLLGIGLFSLVIINTIKNFNFRDRIATAYFATFVSFLLIMIGSFAMHIAPIALIGLTAFWAVESIKKEEQ